MARTSELLVRIGANITDFEKKMGKLQSNLKSVGSKLKGTGKKLTKGITLPAVAAGTALAGITLKKGFERLTSIDSARAKLEGLGHSAKDVDKIMDSALESVKGTSFGLGDAATAAASAVAAGIPPGKELTQYLTNVGDAAAIAGVEFVDMASIFNKVQTGGKATREELNQLADRGIPIFKWLEEATGETGKAFQDMVSNGEIDAATFNKAIQDNIGGAAQIIGEKSFTAGIANVGAALGRLGASFLDAGGQGGGFFSTIKEHIPAVIDYIDGFSDTAERLGQKAGEMFGKLIDGVRNVKEWFDGLSPTLQDIVGKITLFGSIALIAIGPVLMIVGTLMTAFAGVSLAMVKVTAIVIAVAAAVGLLVAGFMHLWNTSETFREVIITVFETIKEVVSTVIQEVVSFVQEIWGGLVEWWSENGEMIKEAAQNVWDTIKTVISTVMDVISSIMEVVWPIILNIIQSTWDAIKGAIQGAIGVITGIIDFFAALFTGNWSALWDSVKKIVSNGVKLVWNLVQLWFVGKILKLGRSLFTGLRGIVSSIWNTIRSLFSSGVGAARNVVSSGFNFIRNIISSIMGAIRSVISSIWNGIRSTISSVVGRIRSTISNIFNSLKGIVSRAFNNVKNAVSNGIKGAYEKVTGFVGKFKEAGRKIVTSIADGIKGAIGKVTDAIGNVAQKVRDFLPFSPAKMGPLRDLDKLDFGGTISVGIDKGAYEVQKAMDEMLSLDYGVGDSSITLGSEETDDSLLEAILEQNEILTQLLRKDNRAVVEIDELYRPIKKRLNQDRHSQYKQRRGK